MRLADLDVETRRIVFLAHVMTRSPSNKVLRKLRSAVQDFDIKHEAERAKNLLHALFEEQVLRPIKPVPSNGAAEGRE